MGNCGGVMNAGSFNARGHSTTGSAIALLAPLGYDSHRLSTGLRHKLWYADVGVIPSSGNNVRTVRGRAVRTEATSATEGLFTIRSAHPSASQLNRIGIMLLYYASTNFRTQSGTVKVPFTIEGNAVHLGTTELNACEGDVDTEFLRAYLAYIAAHRSQPTPDPNTLGDITLHDAEFHLGNNGGLQNVSNRKPIRYTAAEDGMRGFSPPRDYDVWQLHSSRKYKVWTLGFFPVPDSVQEPNNWTNGLYNYDARFGGAKLLAYPVPLANVNSYVRGLTLFRFTYQNKQRSSLTRDFYYLVNTVGSVPIIILHSAGTLEGSVFAACRVIGEALRSDINSQGGDYKLPQQLVPTTGIPIDDRTTRKYGGQILPVGRPQRYNTRYYSASEGGYLELD